MARDFLIVSAAFPGQQHFGIQLTVSLGDVCETCRIESFVPQPRTKILSYGQIDVK